jgi:hypothetical protein
MIATEIARFLGLPVPRRANITDVIESVWGDHMAGGKIELHLPGLMFGVDDIELTGLSRRFERDKPAGPYLITGRASGLDSTPEISGDIHPVMWEPNGKPWQRWRLEPAPDRIGFLIKSPHNGNFLTLTQEARWHLDDPWAPWFASRVGNSPSSGSSPCPWAISDPAPPIG